MKKAKLPYYSAYLDKNLTEHFQHFYKFLFPIPDGVVGHGEISVRTDVDQPGAPSLTALKCQDVTDPTDSSISIQVSSPKQLILISSS